MKPVNHLGSAMVFVLMLVLVLLLGLQVVGIEFNWRPNTTPWRFTQQPFNGWALALLLFSGLVALRWGSDWQQAVMGLLFVGMLLGVALCSALFWDPWLSPILVFSSLPIRVAALHQLQKRLPATQQINEQ